MRKISKNITLSLLAIMALSSQSYAGGDILPQTVFELEEEAQAVKVVPVEEKKVVELVKESTPWYIGAGLTAGRVKDGNCEDITYGVMAKLGYEFNDNFAVEARGMRTNWEYEGAKIKHLGVFLKPQYQVDEDVNLYGLVGYAKTSLNSKYELNENGLALGAGVDYDLGEKDEYSLFVDYERLIQKSNVPNIDALSVGISYNF